MMDIPRILGKKPSFKPTKYLQVPTEIRHIHSAQTKGTHEK